MRDNVPVSRAIVLLGLVEAKLEPCLEILLRVSTKGDLIRQVRNAVGFRLDHDYRRYHRFLRAQNQVSAKPTITGGRRLFGSGYLCRNLE